MIYAHDFTVKGNKGLLKAVEYAQKWDATLFVLHVPIPVPELSDEELNSPAVQKLLLDNLDQLENTNFELEIFEEKFHAVDKEKAVLEEKLKSTQSSEILYTFTLTIGAAIMGLAPTFWTTGYGWLVVIVGFLLVLGGLISKFANR